MTIPAFGIDWCPDCEDTCNAHPTMCTVCGATLRPRPLPAAVAATSGGSTIMMVEAPANFMSTAAGFRIDPQQQQQQQQRPSNNNNNSNNNRRTTATTANGNDTNDNSNTNNNNANDTTTTNNNTTTDNDDTDAIARLETINQQFRQSAVQLTNVLDRMRTRIALVQQEQSRLLQQLGGQREDDVLWETIPPELLDPTTALNGSTQQRRPTSSVVLAGLPRTLLSIESAMFYHCTITLNHPHNARPVSSSSSVSQQQREDQTTTSTSTSTTMIAIPGEFGNYNRQQTIHIRNAYLVVADPLTGGSSISSGGTTTTKSRRQQQSQSQPYLSSATRTTIQQIQQQQRQQNTNTTTSDSPIPIVLYFVRGGGITFVEKARLAQQVGATACIIGNHVSHPWPFAMQDSINAAAASVVSASNDGGGDGSPTTTMTAAAITIPTVLVSKSDGEFIAHQYHQQMKQAESSSSSNSSIRPVSLSCSLDMQPIATLNSTTNNKSNNNNNSMGTILPPSCAVCTEMYEPGQTIVTLPKCGHVFHETCVLPWLQHHNTCPYCRQELPLEHDDQTTRSNGQQQPTRMTNNNSRDATTTTLPFEFYG